MLIDLFFILLYTVGFIFECYILYLAVMNFKAQRHVLHWVVKVMAVIILAVGYVLDLILTMVVGTVVFLSLPKWNEWTFTARLKRHRADGGWRGKVAAWICEEMLNPFVVGGHC